VTCTTAIGGRGIRILRAMRKDALSPLAGEIAKLGPTKEGLAELERGSPPTVERPASPLPGPPLAQVGQARLASIDADFGQAREQWGREASHAARAAR
jgi:hypothetical protein